MKSKIVPGELIHSRFSPVKRTFRYPLMICVFDLDEVERLDREVFFFGHNRFNLLSIYDRDYVLGKKGGIREKLSRFLESKGYPAPPGRIEWVTAPRCFGMGFNPVSFYFCRGTAGEILYVIAEVNNTVGERHFYVLDKPVQSGPGFPLRYRHPVEFFVSPFMGAEGEYEFHFSILDDFLDIRITNRREGDMFFFARFSGKALPFTQGNAAKVLLRHPLPGLLTFPRILWQGILLLLREKLPLRPKPEPRHPMTFRLAGPSLLQRFARKVILGYLGSLKRGSLTLFFPDKTPKKFTEEVPGQEAEIHIYNHHFFTRVLASGDIGFGESFTQGEWDSPDMQALLGFFIRNQEAVDRQIVRKAFWGNALNLLRHFLRRNSLRGSRKNIRDHYDLGNAFYGSFLDPSMVYSCGIFDGSDCGLEQAQVNKMDAILRKARISAEDHVLEIGCGWGSLAARAVRTTGCRVTGITLSEEQQRFALEKVRQEDLTGKIDIRLTDYRNIQGSFDRIVSVEMLEAVGHEYLDLFFRTCTRLLKPGGLAAFQMITIPDDRYKDYLKRPDWIQKHIFPGGFLPSLAALKQSIAKTPLEIREIESIGPHYATTLARWRENFIKNQDSIIGLGFDKTFLRKWLYYFHYCEAGFSAGMIDTVQMVLKH